jgi:hypothetical protein
MAGTEGDYYAFEVRVVGNNTNTTPPMLVPFSEARTRDDLWDETVAKTPFYRDHRFLAAQAGQEVSPPTILLQETSTSNHKTEHIRWRSINWDEAIEYSRWFNSNVAQGTARRLKIEIHFFTADKLQEYWPYYDWITRVGRDLERMDDTNFTEIPFNVNLEELRGLNVVPGTNNWFPERDIDVLASANDCPRCEEKAVALGLKRPSLRRKKATKAAEAQATAEAMETDTQAEEAGDEDVEMEDVVPNVAEGGGWTMDLARR